MDMVQNQRLVVQATAFVFRSPCGKDLTAPVDLMEHFFLERRKKA